MGRNIEARILVKSQRVKGKIEFELETKYKKDKGITFKNPKKDDHFDMVFVIRSNEFGLAFPDKEQAFWVSKVDCPKAPSYDDEFEARRVSDDGQRLMVRNWNRRVQDYWFALNFSTASDGPQCYDPIIINQNGFEEVEPGFGFPRSLVIAGVAAGAALLVALARKVSRSNDRERY